MANKVLQKEIREEDVLASLEAAISSYNTKVFENIGQDEIAVVKKVKKAKKEKVIEVEKNEKVSKVKKTKTKSAKKVKKFSPRTKKLLVLKPIGKSFGTVASRYKKQFSTVALTVVMLSFVSLTSYIAYAYVSNNNNDILGKVSQHVILPDNETPKVYIIQSEKSEIMQNPLFKGIKVGDNVLSYTSSGKVVIYRSSEDKIVNIVNTAQ